MAPRFVGVGIGGCGSLLLVLSMYTWTCQAFAPPRSGSGWHSLSLRRAASSSSLEDFVSYAQEKLEVTLENCEPALFEGGLRGVAATGKGIEARQEFIKVPGSNCLVTTTDAVCPLPFVDREFWRRSSWDVRLALLLINEERKSQGLVDGEESLLAPWLSVLPRNFDTPLHWDAKALESLGYPALINAVDTQRAEWSQIHSNLVKSSPTCGVTLEKLTWAMEVAHSRTFSGPYEGRGNKERVAEVLFVSFLAALAVLSGLATRDQVANGVIAVLVSIPLRDFFTAKLVPELKRYALIPMIDLVNHGSVESDVAYSYFGDYFGASISSGSVAPGSQIFISYGRWSNDHLLQYYGFVEQSNPNDEYLLTGLIEKAARQLGDKANEQMALVQSVARGAGGSADCAKLSRNGLENPIDVMPCLRLLVLDDEGLGGRDADSVTLATLNEVLSPENEAAAQKVLLSVVAAEAAELKARSDSKLGFGGGPRPGSTPIESLASAFCEEKVKVLQFALDALKKSPGSLPS
jgi:hypothetical protein